MSSENTRTLAFSNIFKGAAWSFALRWSVKLIGLASTIILARLLTPQDFGIVAIASVTSAFLMTFSQIGIANLLIREDDINRELCDTAWTLQILQGVFLAALLFALSIPASHYFNEPLAIAVIHMYGISALIGSTANIGLVLFRRDLEFSKDFHYGLYKRLIRFAVVISLALLIRNYWALVIGQLVTSLAGVILSYIMHEYRPRISLKYARKFYKFGISIVPLSIATFLTKKVDLLIVGGLFTTPALGFYSIASELGSVFTREIVLPISRGLLPNLAKIKHDPKLLTEVFSNVIGLIVIVALPLGLGLSAVAELFVPVLLGSQWNEAIPILVWLALYGATSSILHILSGQVQIVTGHEHIAAILTWVRVILLFVSVSIFARIWGIQGAAAGAFFSTLIALPIIAAQLNRSVGISVNDLFILMWRPLLSAAAMYFIVEQLGQFMTGLNIYARLAAEGIAGAFFYCIALWSLWYLSGRPNCIESQLTKKLVYLINIGPSKLGKKS